MKALIFCGGKGTRYNEDKNDHLKPLIKVKNLAILERIINFFLIYGVNEFILLGGYKFDDLKKFANKFKKINVRAVFTGVNTSTGGRLNKVKKYIKNNENFFLTYGDSLIEHDLKNIINKKKRSNNFYVCSYKYEFPYGVFNLENKKKVASLNEKKLTFQINSGFYCLDSRIFKYIKSNNDSFESHVIKRLIKSDINLDIVKIKKWMPMDNKTDRYALERIISKGTSFKLIK